MPDTHTISFEGSRYTWDQVDAQAKQRGFKERSKYIQWLAENDLERKKTVKDFVNYEVLFLLLLSMCMLMLILIYNSIG